MEVFEHDDMMREIILNLDLKSIIYFLKSNKSIKIKVRKLLHELLPIIFNNYIDDLEELNTNTYLFNHFIFDLLKINEIDIAREAFILYRNMFPKEADIEISSIKYKYFKQLINIVPPDFDWYYINEQLINEFVDEDLIKDVFVPALESNITLIIQTFVDYWENNRDDQKELQYIMDPLITKAEKILKEKIY